VLAGHQLRVGFLVVIPAVVLTAACGADGAASSAAASVGDDRLLQIDTPRASPQPDATTLTGAPHPETPPPEATPSGVANRTERDDSSGVRLTFVVADALEFGPSDQVRMELTITNTATSTRYASAEQPSQFSLTGAASDGMWDDERCNTALDVDDIPAPVPIEPGESIRFTATYPYDERCRVPAGRYLAAARVEMCPPETLVETSNGQPVCDRARNQQLDALPLEVVIRP